MSAPQTRPRCNEATVDDLDDLQDLAVERADVLAERAYDDGIPPPRCSCDRPLGDGDGGCIRCGRSVAA